jgi:hypothetical protein
MGLAINNQKHPHYESYYQDYLKWRSVWEGGQQFVDKYLQKLSARESDDDFTARKCITYIPAHAKAAITDVRNAIFQRMPDVIRRAGPESYQSAISGEERGVDLNGSSMNSWLAHNILPELMVMSRVGIFVDRPRITSHTTLAEQPGSPYLYFFQAEDIQSWHYDVNGELDAVLVKEHNNVIDEDTGLVTSSASRFRLMRLTSEGVLVTYWDFRLPSGVAINKEPELIELVDEAVLLKMDRIPFIILDIGQSLLADVANHQIAMLNLASSDMNYAIKSNFPFYTEQIAQGQQLPHNRQPGRIEATSASAQRGGARVINVGATQGRAYPRGTERPAFIHPSSEPLRASMDKQQQLKNEIRELINLALSNVNPGRASAESKLLDNQGLEAGLSYIGLEVERAEREIAKFWSAYESSSNVAHVKYPDNYQLKTDKDRRQEASELEELKDGTPSVTYKKEICKQIARVTLGPKVPLETMQKINEEIDNSIGVETSSITIRNDVEAGLLSLETAAGMRGYPKGEVEIAKQDHAERLARVQLAQTSPKDRPAARGLPDFDANPDSADEEKTESQDTTTQGSTANMGRGDA